MVFKRSAVTDPFVNETPSFSDVSHRRLSLGRSKALELLAVITGIKYLHQSDYANQRINESNEISHSQGYLDTFRAWHLAADVSRRFDIKVY